MPPKSETQTQKSSWIDVKLVLQVGILGGTVLLAAADIKADIRVIQNDLIHLWKAQQRLENLVDARKQTFFENR